MKQILPIALAILMTALGTPSTQASAGGDAQLLIENGNKLPRSALLGRSVALLTYGGGGSFCSASFLSSRTLITAAHCAAKSITVNVMNPAGGYYQARSSRVIVHPQFHRTHDRYGMVIIKNDLAIIQLAQPFPVPVRPVTLAAFPDLERGRWATVTDVGYGFNRGKTGGKTLRWGKMLAHKDEIFQFGDRVGLEQRNSNNQNVCPGDSGGAVFYGNESSRLLVAVHSLANGCGSGRSTGASSELVWPAHAWIKSQVR